MPAPVMSALIVVSRPQPQGIVPESLNGTVYEELKRRKFRPPSQSGKRPNKEVLRKHLAEWGLKSP